MNNLCSGISFLSLNRNSGIVLLGLHVSWCPEECNLFGTGT